VKQEGEIDDEEVEEGDEVGRQSNVDTDDKE
jgi:hypothetical protein